MNFLDIMIVVLGVTAVIGGYRLGFLARVTSWVGLALGLVVAARFLPSIVDALHNDSPTTRQLVVVGTLIGAGFIGQALGLLVGSAVKQALPFGPPRIADRAAGALAGLVGVVAAVWLILPSMADAPGFWAREARNSTLARAIDSIPVRPPDTLQALRRLVGEENFPKVFDALQPARNTGAPPASAGLPQGVASAVGAATVKVEGIACRRIQDGSGFSVAPDVIVTNAHVVAGERLTSVVAADGRRLRAVVAVFDSNRDLAVLRVPGLGDPALFVGKGRQGEVGAVFGHPGGQASVSIAPASINEEIVALGRDLYDQHETSRHVFVLAADLHPGDSGGPLVDQRGILVGVAFAIAPDRPGTAYALTTDELRPVLAQGSSGAAPTGPCLTTI